MNTSKHTPGLWTQDGINWINTPDSGGYRCVTISGEDYDIANVMVDEGDETQGANAALICAAPDLLAALQELLADRYLSDPINKERMANARAAIAKAINTSTTTP
jgi:hypothetical protein